MGHGLSWDALSHLLEFLLGLLTCALPLQIEAAAMEERQAIRAVCISQVLATDLKKHFDITSRFQVPQQSILLCLPHIPLCLPGSCFVYPILVCLPRILLDFPSSSCAC